MAISIPINEDGTINRINVDGDEYYFGLEVNPESLAKVATATDAATKAAEKANLGESSRVDAETKRVSAESTRANAETARDQAEQARAADQLKNNTDQEQNNAAARGLTYHVCALGEYQLDTVDKAHNVPTVDGKTGVMYLTPKVNGETTEDRYDQWMYIEYKWELMGESGVHIDPTTTDDIDNIAAGTSVASDRVLNTTGLSYLWSKLKAAFAPKSHSHDATSITGSLEVSHGGTGATTAADALTNLGAASQTDVDALRDSVSQDIGGASFTAVSGLFVNIYECLAGVCVGCNVSPSASISSGGKILTITTGRTFISRGQILIRGAFPNKQPGVYVTFDADGHTIRVTAEQSVTLAQQNTFNFLIPVTWEI